MQRATKPSVSTDNAGASNTTAPHQTLSKISQQPRDIAAWLAARDNGPVGWMGNSPPLIANIWGMPQMTFAHKGVLHIGPLPNWAVACPECKCDRVLRKGPLPSQAVARPRCERTWVLHQHGLVMLRICWHQGSHRTLAMRPSNVTVPRLLWSKSP